MRPPHPVDDLTQRIQRDGRVFRLPDGDLGIFSPEAVDEADAANFAGLTIPPGFADIFRPARPIAWQAVRASVFAEARKLNAAGPLAALYGRMEEHASAAPQGPTDLTLFASRLAPRSLIGTVVADFHPAELALVERDHDWRLDMLFGDPDTPPDRRATLSGRANEVRVGRAVRRVVRERRAGRRPPQLDFTQGLLPWVDEMGVGRTAYVLTTLLTAISGAPGPVAACLLHELLTRPEWKAAVSEEMTTLSVDDLCEAPGRRAPKTQRFVMEVLRFWSFPLLARRTVKRSFSVEGHALCPGQSYVLSTWLPHRDPEFWDKPERFDPDRWSAAFPATCPGAYVPFGWGARTCLGATLGMSQLILFCHLMTVTFQVELDPSSDPRIALGNIAAPLDLVGAITRAAPQAV
jgi:cytochrome P450